MSRKAGSWESRSASSDIFVARLSAVYRLAQQVGQRQRRILAPATFGQVPFHQLAEAQTFAQFAHQN
jgi:hypothetical protein